jgi:hypothetical protein
MHFILHRISAHLYPTRSCCYSEYRSSSHFRSIVRQIASKMLMVLVVFTPHHVSKPSRIYQSSVQPPYRSWAGCHTVYQYKLPSLSQGPGNFCTCKCRGIVRMTVGRISWSIITKVTCTVREASKILLEEFYMKSTTNSAYLCAVFERTCIWYGRMPLSFHWTAWCCIILQTSFRHAVC